MLEIGGKIREAREQKGITQKDLGILIGKTKSTISNYETGLSSPDAETLLKLSEILEVGLSVLYGKDKLVAIKEFPIEVPVIAMNDIKRGDPEGERIIDYIYLRPGRYEGECIAIKVTGDCMNMRRIYEDDIVLVRKQTRVENGDIVVCIVNKKSVLMRRFTMDGGKIVLTAESFNPKHKPIVLDADDDNCMMVGVVIGAMITP